MDLSKWDNGNTSSYEYMEITVAGDLRVSGCDHGEAPMAVWGASNYEYWLTVKSEWKDSILLLLLKERFKDMSAFRSWLDGHEVPSSFTNWA